MKTFNKNIEVLSMLKSYFVNPKKFKQLIDSNKNISISGSSIMMLLNNKDYEKSDIDVYIDISGVTPLLSKLLEEIHDFLISSKYKVKKGTLEGGIHTVNLIPNDIDKFIYNPYWSLREYIHKVIRYTNPFRETSIDFIFITMPIHKMIMGSFDMDIVKNYYCMGMIYSYFYKSIVYKKATINKEHFIKRICHGSEYEKIKFVQRYRKYTRRGFSIYIDSNEVDESFIDYLENNTCHYDIEKVYYSFMIRKIIKNYILRKNINLYAYIIKNSIVTHNPSINFIINNMKKCEIIDRNALQSKKRSITL